MRLNRMNFKPRDAPQTHSRKRPVYTVLTISKKRTINWSMSAARRLIAPCGLITLKTVEVSGSRCERSLSISNNILAPLVLKTVASAFAVVDLRISVVFPFRKHATGFCACEDFLMVIDWWFECNSLYVYAFGKCWVIFWIWCGFILMSVFFEMCFFICSFVLMWISMISGWDFFQFWNIIWIVWLSDWSIRRFDRARFCALLWIMYESCQLCI